MKVSERSSALLVIAVAALILAIVIFIWQSGSSSQAIDTATTYAYDLTASELNISPIENLPASSASPQYAWAKVYSCGECNAEQRFIGYLEQFDGALLAELRSSAETRGQAESFIAQHQGPPEDHMIKRPGDAEWVPYDSPQGQAIRNEVMNECGGDRPKPCSP